jgi:Domain of unknown function (DUF4349)
MGYQPPHLRRAALPLVLLLPGLLLACSSAASAPAAPDQERSSAALAPVAAPAPAPNAAPAAQSGDAGTPSGPLIVRTGSLELEVADVDASVNQARDAMTALGGYVSGSDEVNSGDKHQATITYRVPVEHWQDALTALRGMADRVVRESTQAQEVTAQVVDLGAQIDNLRTSEASLRDIMTRAGTITDVLSVQERLESVQGQIERLVAQQQDVTDQAALGTLAVTWENPVVAVAAAQGSWDVGTEIDNAAAQTVRAAQAVASALIWVAIVGVPVVGPFLLLALLFIWWLRRYAARHPRRAQVGWGPALAAGTGSQSQPAAPTGPAETPPDEGVNPEG